VLLKGLQQYVLAIAYKARLFLTCTAKVLGEAAFSYLFNQPVIVDVLVQSLSPFYRELCCVIISIYLPNPRGKA
jgi:hypothetical protein